MNTTTSTTTIKTTTTTNNNNNNLQDLQLFVKNIPPGFSNPELSNYFSGLAKEKVLAKKGKNKGKKNPKNVILTFQSEKGLCTILRFCKTEKTQWKARKLKTRIERKNYNLSENQKKVVVSPKSGSNFHDYDLLNSKNVRSCFSKFGYIVKLTI